MMEKVYVITVESMMVDTNNPWNSEIKPNTLKDEFAFISKDEAMCKCIELAKKDACSIFEDSECARGPKVWVSADNDAVMVTLTERTIIYKVVELKVFNKF
jgi:hypothetical protein